MGLIYLNPKILAEVRARRVAQIADLTSIRKLFYNYLYVTFVKDAKLT